jgi:hypothetical protein
MIKRPLGLLLAACAIQSADAQQPAADAVPGYRHTAQKSRFFAGENLARIESITENDLVKYRGAGGVLVTDEKTGLTMAVQSASQDKAAPAAKTRKPAAPLDPDMHNRRVLDYFLQAGLPRDQIERAHANTYLSASGPASKAISVQPRVDGYATIVSRKADQYRVVDSVAWARMDEKGRIVSEWVYWPPIPAGVVADARRLNERVSGRQRDAFLAKTGATRNTGQVVIRHSSPFADGAFSAFASYDVVEQTQSAGKRGTAVTIRHFDVDGKELRLPQEMRSAGQDYPPKDDGAQTLPK